MTLQINTSTGARALTTDEQTEARTGLGAEASGAGAAAVSTHVAQSDPHPGKYAAADHTHALLMTTEERAKLAGVADGATANAADAALRDRATHTGEQAQSTVTGLVTALAGKATTAQGTKADTALQPGAQLTQAAVTSATAAGVALLGAADAATQRTALGLGTAATTPASNYATAAQGAKADAALPGNADALADLLESAATGAAADLARIQASVSKDWADVIPAEGIPAADFNAEVQLKLRRNSATVSLGVPISLGRISVAMTAGASLSFAFDFDFSAAVLSEVPGEVVFFAESVPHVAGVMQKVSPSTALNQIGKFQRVYITDRLNNQTYLCAGTIGPGFDNNVISIEIIGT